MLLKLYHTLLKGENRNINGKTKEESHCAGEKACLSGEVSPRATVRLHHGVKGGVIWRRVLELHLAGPESVRASKGGREEGHTPCRGRAETDGKF